MKYSKCAVCEGSYPLKGDMMYRLHSHHYLSGIWRKLKVGEEDDKGNVQKIILVCCQCHDDLHSLGNESFYKKHKKERKKFIWVSDKIMLYKEDLCN